MKERSGFRAQFGVALLGAVPSQRPSRLTRRQRAIAFAAALVVGGSVAGVAYASCATYEIGYCNRLVGPGDYCAGPFRHTYDTNSAHYDGSGNLTVCERVDGYYSGSTYSYACANRAVYADLGCNPTDYHWFNVYVRNGSPSNPHTIRGVASY
jgi:hypothetical protein